jgi:hypothetical protein
MRRKISRILFVPVAAGVLVSLASDFLAALAFPGFPAAAHYRFGFWVVILVTGAVLLEVASPVIAGLMSGFHSKEKAFLYGLVVGVAIFLIRTVLANLNLWLLQGHFFPWFFAFEPTEYRFPDLIRDLWPILLCGLSAQLGYLLAKRHKTKKGSSIKTS